MAEHTQIDFRRGNDIARVHSGWGTPDNIVPALRAAAKKPLKTVNAIARSFIKNVPDASFGLELIEKDFQPDDLSFHYVVDVTAKPWTVTKTKCAGYALVDNGDGTASVGGRVPARTATFTIPEANALEAFQNDMFDTMLRDFQTGTPLPQIVAFSKKTIQLGTVAEGGVKTAQRAIKGWFTKGEIDAAVLFAIVAGKVVVTIYKDAESKSVQKYPTYPSLGSVYEVKAAKAGR